MRREEETVRGKGGTAKRAGGAVRKEGRTLRKKNSGRPGKVEGEETEKDSRE